MIRSQALEYLRMDLLKIQNKYSKKIKVSNI